MNDLHRGFTYKLGLAPAVVTDNTAQVSNIIDTQGFVHTEFVILTGTLADVDATFTVLVEDGNVSNLSDAAAVGDADLVGLETDASFTFAADNTTKKIGYQGVKRYVRMTITPANNTGNAPLAVAVVQVPRHVS